MRSFLLLGLVACTTPPGSDAVDTDADTDVVVNVPDDVAYHRDVRPILERSCSGCHSATGIAPFDLSYSAAAWSSGAPSWVGPAAGAIASRTMPPWHAADDCHPIEGSPALSAQELAIVAAWADKGFPEGDPSTYVAPELPPVVDPGPADLVLKGTAAYTPKRFLPDDYHCVPLGDALEADLDVQALEVVPGDKRMVHHAILYVVGPSAAAGVAAADAAEAGVGYTCFGGPLPGGGGLESSDYTNAGTYVPGYEREVLPEGDVRRWVAGSRLVLQLHYNLLSIPSEEAVPADDSEVRLWRAEGTPSGIITTIALPNYGIVIDAGDPDSRHEQTFRFGAAATVVGAMGHMHTLGKALKVEVIRGGNPLCALDIPRWDFDWQRAYRFPDDEPFLLRTDDTVRTTCVYDNSAANQPIVNGERQEPRDVRWGEGTLDEMCLAYALVRVPSAVFGEEDCGAFEGCFRGCPSGDGDCIGRCLDRATDACSACGVLALGGCAEEACGASFLPLGACLQSCPDDTFTCLRTDCRDQTFDYLTCIGDDVLAGTCDPWLGECGISFSGTSTP